MVRPDTGSFNRLLTSLGLVYLAAALVVPYFYFKNTAVLKTTKIELDGLTPIARQALSDRQSGIAALEPWVIALAIILAVLGAALVIAGAVRLKKAQDSEDEEAELRKDRARAEIRGLTPEEEAQKATAEAEQESEEEDGSREVESSADRKPQATDTGAVAPELPVGQSPQDRTEAPRVIVTKQAILRVEKRFNEIFQRAQLGRFDFKSNLGIRSNLGRIEIDGLFSSKSASQENVVLELKVLRNGRAVVRNARNRAEQALATSARFNSIAVEHAAVWLVMVVASETTEEVTDQDLVRAQETCGRFMLDRGAATVVREQEMERLPKQFLRLVEAGDFEANFI